MNPRYHVWIIDDEPEVAESCAELLQQFYITQTFTRAKDALLALEKEQGKNIIFISDIIMPEMDGIKLLENLKRQKNPPQTILMSGSTSFETLKKASHLSISGFIEKPYTPEILINAIKTAILYSQNERITQNLLKLYSAHSLLSQKLLQSYKSRYQYAENQLFNLNIPLYSNNSGKENFQNTIQNEAVIQRALNEIEVQIQRIEEKNDAELKKIGSESHN